MQYETFNRAWCRGGIGILAVGAIALVTLSSAADRPGVAAKPELTKLERSRVQVTRTDQQDETVSGKELFSREWLADDPRSKGGDGLGPVFNESSCVACHNLGGVGGAGSLSKNVELVTALSVNSRRFSNADSPNSTNPLPVGPRRSTNPRDELIRLHPGFREAQTVVLHRFGTNSGHEQWRANFFGNQSLFAPVAFGLNVNADRFSQVAEELAPNPVDDDFGTSDGEDSTGFAPDGSRAARAENSPFGDPAQQSGTTASSAPNQALPTAQPAPVRQVTPRPTTPQFQPPSEPSPRRPTQPPTQPPRQDPVDPFAPATQAPQVVRQQTTAQQAIPQPFPSSPAPARFGPVDQPSAAPNAVPTQSQRNPSQGTFAPPQIQQSIVSSSSQFPIVIEATRRIQQLKQQAQSGLTSQRTVARNAVQFSQRNTPALFGAGLIDAIPESALIAASKIKHEDSPRVSGRIARDKEGHVGRFGWKAQKTSLVEFTLAACAVELGLNVPGHAQAGVPYKPDHKSKGLDLNEKQLAALVDYLKNLPRPIQNKPKNVQAAAVIDDGERLFETVGCAACHTRKLGDVDGLYGDLLLHDMGPELGGTGSYGVFAPSVPGSRAAETPQAASQTSSPKPNPAAVASQVEWRTPPLWGVRDSAPYLHDGRVATLEQAIAFHGGEASDSTIKFFMLSHAKQQKVIAFLKTLTAPDTDAKPEAAAKTVEARKPTSATR